nr:J domain-containing protein required for chloroplast accumulation response 1 isoform X1 [Ipomoea batatas]
MDESWRMRMGMEMPSTTTTTKTSLPRRRSTEDNSHRRRTVLGDSESSVLDPEDFSDVFGGPPRSVMRRQFSGNEYRKTLFYEEIFTPPENVIPARCGRNLPEFRIPMEKCGRMYDQGFYSDIFGWEEEDEVRRSRTRSGSKSKASSSSVLSSEDVSPLRPAIGEADPDVSFFASKLRPINVASRWNTRKFHEEYPRYQGMPAFSCHPPSYNNTENEHSESLRNTHFGFSRRNSSPETISVDPNSYRSLKISTDHDLDLNSPPSSVASSLGQDQEASRGCGIQDDLLNDDDQVVTEQEEDEVMSSYVIEINTSSGREILVDEAIGVDEAIAWAKEKFQRHCSETENNPQMAPQQEKEHSDMPSMHQSSDEQIDGTEFTQATIPDEEADKCAEGEGRQNFDTDMEMELLDEKIRIWLTGKEGDIRLLLSTLHHILWFNSGWLPVPLTYLIESSRVKKAYQKARLCLHPDKLQQRGATIPQKHIAEKVFSILQDAWAVFLSQDIRIG